ncbi:MAG: flagellar assembly protein FliW, partial [Tissierellia bacterium]|nr:flagellar assembly protein FliW [Tissierellia bacterium]
YPDYDIRISKVIRDRLDIRDEKDVAIYSIVVVPEDMEDMTANLLGPVIINIDKKLGKQIILDDDRYSTKYYIFRQQNNIEDGSGQSC